MDADVFSIQADQVAPAEDPAVAVVVVGFLYCILDRITY